MSGEINEAIEHILANGEVPARVTNRLLLAVMLELAERQDRTEQSIQTLTRRIEQVETYPSMLALLWKHPKTTVVFVFLLFGLLILAYQAGGIYTP